MHPTLPHHPTKPAAGAAPRRRALLLLVAATVLPLAACSTYKLAYGLADTFLLRMVNQTFDLTGAQRREVKAKIGEFMAWHRHEELPRYVTWLDEMRARMADGLSEEDVRFGQRGFDEIWRRAIEKMAPDAAAFLATIGSSQIDHMVLRTAQRNAERWEDYDAPVEEFVRKRARGIEKNFARFTGAWSAKQRELLADFLRRRREDLMTSRKVVQRSQDNFADVLRRHPEPTVIKQELITRLVRSERLLNAAERAAQDRVEADLIQLALAWDAAATPEQRTRLADSLLALRNDLDELAHDR